MRCHLESIPARSLPRLAALLLVLVALLPVRGPTPGLNTRAASFAPDFSFQKTPGSSTLLIPAEKLAAFSLMRTGLEDTNVDIHFHLSPFVQQGTGASLSAGIVSGSLPGATTNSPDGTVQAVKGQATLEMRISAPDIRGSNAYEGNLFLREGRSPTWTPYPLLLRSPFLASTSRLAVDQTNLDLKVSRPNPIPFVSGTGATFSVHLLGAAWPSAPGSVSVGVERVDKAPEGGFDLERWIALSHNGLSLSERTNDNSTAFTQASANSMPAGQNTLRGEFLNLPVGEYDLTLRVQPAGAGPEESVQLRLKLQVRDHWVKAAMFLLGSVVAAWFITKFLGFVRKRLLLQQRTQQQEKLARFDNRHLPGAVRARALLAQARALAGRTWLSGTEAIDSRIQEATLCLAYLRKADELLKDVDRSNLDQFIKVRIRVKVRALCALLERLPESDATRPNLLKELADLRDWMKDETQMTAIYHVDLTKDLNALVTRHRLESQPNLLGGSFPRLSELMLAARPQAGDTLAMLLEREDAYARLKVLCERFGNPEFSDLLPEKRFITTFFKKSDAAAWARLKKAENAAGFRVSVDGGGIEEFDLFEFNFTTGDPELDQTFLVSHGITYEWTWVVSGSWWKTKGRETTKSPTLVQFSPIKGELTATLSCYWGGDASTASTRDSVSVGKSSDFGFLAGFEKVELVSLLAAMAFAVASGLVANYVNAPTFGSFRDYLNLIVWGVGVDLAKSTLMMARQS